MSKTAPISPAKLAPDPSVPLRTVALSIAGLWLTYYLLATLRWELLGFGYSAQMAQLRAIVSLAGMGVTWALWALLRLFDARPVWMKLAAALLLSAPAALLLAQLNSHVFSGMKEKLEAQYRGSASDSNDPFIDLPMSRDHPGPGEGMREGPSEGWFFSNIEPLTEVAFGRYFMMLAWCALYLAMLAGERARAAERREQAFRNAAKAAELRSLRYQVNPHFLFNTLNSLSSLVITGQGERAEQMIQTMSDFYRHSLAADPTGDVPLEQEFDLQRLYLQIEQVRFPERLRYAFELPEQLRDVRVPGMILQPLVENSVKYAVSASKDPVHIRIVAREEPRQLVLRVEDDGPGSGAQASEGFGIGLANVRDRLMARFGQEARIESGPGEAGYRTVIRVPLTRLARGDGRKGDDDGTGRG